MTGKDNMEIILVMIITTRFIDSFHQCHPRFLVLFAQYHPRCVLARLFPCRRSIAFIHLQDSLRFVIQCTSLHLSKLSNIGHSRIVGVLSPFNCLLLDVFNAFIVAHLFLQLKPLLKEEFGLFL